MINRPCFIYHKVTTINPKLTTTEKKQIGHYYPPTKLLVLVIAYSTALVDHQNLHDALAPGRSPPAVFCHLGDGRLLATAKSLMKG